MTGEPSAAVTGAAVHVAESPVPVIPPMTAEIPRMPLAVRDVAGPLLLGTAAEALADAGVTRADHAEVACVLGTAEATAPTTEYIAAVLAGPGPRWLDPQCFLYYSPHALTGQLCIGLRLGGPAVTLCGRASGVDALGYGMHLLASGRCAAVLAVGIDWPAGPPAVAAVGAAVLAPAGGWATVREWRHDRPGPSRRPRGLGEFPDVVAPLAELVSVRNSRLPGSRTLAAGHARLTVVS